MDHTEKRVLVHSIMNILASFQYHKMHSILQCHHMSWSLASRHWDIPLLSMIQRLGQELFTWIFLCILSINLIQKTIIWLPQWGSERLSNSACPMSHSWKRQSQERSSNLSNLNDLTTKAFHHSQCEISRSRLAEKARDKESDLPQSEFQWNYCSSRVQDDWGVPSSVKDVTPPKSPLTSLPARHGTLCFACLIPLNSHRCLWGR